MLLLFVADFNNDLGTGKAYKTIGFQLIEENRGQLQWYCYETNHKISNLSLVKQGADRLLANLEGYQPVGIGDELPSNQEIVEMYGYLPFYDSGYSKWILRRRREQMTNNNYQPKKYHISLNGKFSPCNALIRECPRGMHFEDTELAQEYLDLVNEGIAKMEENPKDKDTIERDYSIKCFDFLHGKSGYVGGADFERIWRDLALGKQTLKTCKNSVK